MPGFLHLRLAPLSEAALYFNASHHVLWGWGAHGESWKEVLSHCCGPSFFLASLPVIPATQAHITLMLEKIQGHPAYTLII